MWADINGERKKVAWYVVSSPLIFCLFPPQHHNTTLLSALNPSEHFPPVNSIVNAKVCLLSLMSADEITAAHAYVATAHPNAITATGC